MLFSISQQSFYDSSLSYQSGIPDDCIDVTNEEHYMLLDVINKGCRVYLEGGNVTYSPPRPSNYHHWDAEQKSWSLSDELAVAYGLQQYRLELIKHRENIKLVSVCLMELKCLKNHSSDKEIIQIDNFMSKLDSLLKSMIDNWKLTKKAGQIDQELLINMDELYG